jgi:hypothetical protein
MMTALLLVPLGLQSVAMIVDEFYFHRQRGLPKWERWGHPIDTLSVLAVYAVALWVPYTTFALYVFLALAAFSSLLITKDEWVHSRVCKPGEQWLHAILFVLHPVVLASLGAVWASSAIRFADLQSLKPAIGIGAAMTLLMLVHQVVYWNFGPWLARSVGSWRRPHRVMEGRE